MRALPSEAFSVLDRIGQAEAVAALDLALGRLLAGLDAEQGPEDPARTRAIALTGALVSHLRLQGHSAVALADYAGRPFPGDAHDRLPSLPEEDAWRAALEASPVVGGPRDAVPLVLRGGLVALKRFSQAEARAAWHVQARLSSAAVPEESSEARGVQLQPGSSGPPSDGGRPSAVGGHPEGPSDAARDAFARLFPTANAGPLDRQALAAAAALKQRVLFVAGGPGTGKTYTAARLLALFLAEHPGARIALAAPTGKAAARLKESVAARLADLPPDLAAPVPSEATTLHRLLGGSPARPGFRYGPGRPLAVDLVLVDEGSMVDLPLFDALLAALQPHARLVVLGDPDQLAPVEAGTPFADACAAGAGDPPPSLAAFCRALGLDGVPEDPDAAPLAAAVVTLTHSRRFTADSAVGALATAIRDADADAALQVLDDASRPAVSLQGQHPAAEAVAWALPFARDVVASGSPEEALKALGRFRLLAAVRRGPRGVEGLGAALERALRDADAARWNPYHTPFYAGRPLLVTVNDRETGLANGDVGVCWTEAGERVVVFPEGEALKTVRLERLPPHEPAWALTIHKSQGSEFEAVGAVLPEPATRGATLLTRELLYTAATRAREAVVVFGERDAVAEAVVNRQRRTSGLAERLGAGGTTDG